MIDPRFVAKELPEILREEGEYGDGKFLGEYPQRQVPVQGYPIDSPPALEFSNYLSRLQNFDGEGEAYAPQLSQAYLKFLNTGRTLVRAFTEALQEVPNAEVADVRAMMWIQYEVLAEKVGKRRGLMWSGTRELSLDERLSDIDRLVTSGAADEAQTAARELFIAQAQFCVAGIARAGVLPAAGSSTEGAFEHLPPGGLQQVLFMSDLSDYRQNTDNVL